jgi:hypothetical protein
VAALRAHAPVDGLLGLSQGAAAAAAAAAALQGCADADAAPLRFVWLAGGFVAAPTAALLQQRSAPLPLPSLHVFGADADAQSGGDAGGGDAQVAARHSGALAACFAAPCIIRHAGGHLLPAARQHCREYATFLNQFLN